VGEVSDGARHSVRCGKSARHEGLAVLIKLAATRTAHGAIWLISDLGLYLVAVSFATLKPNISFMLS
jgi:hypothetical protein